MLPEMSWQCHRTFYIDSNIGQPPNLLSFVFLTRPKLEKSHDASGIRDDFQLVLWKNRPAYKKCRHTTYTLYQDAVGGFLLHLYSLWLFVSFNPGYDKTVLLSAFLVKNYCSAAKVYVLRRSEQCYGFPPEDCLHGDDADHCRCELCRNGCATLVASKQRHEITRGNVDETTCSER